MLDLDEKLFKFLKAVRIKGGVVNIHVVRATAEALIHPKCSTVLGLICLVAGCSPSIGV